MVEPMRFSIIRRVTFGVHLVVAIIVGALMLLTPNRAVGMFNIPTALDYEPMLRSFGALILGFGGLTSLYGFLTSSWERIDIIVRGEIAYLAIQVVVYIVSLIVGSGVLLQNIVFLVISVVLLALFLLTYVLHPK